MKLNSEITDFEQLLGEITSFPLPLKIISVDFFDTLVSRKIPELALIKKLFDQFQLRYHLPISFDDFTLYREQAYSMTKAKLDATINPDREITIAAWYRELFGALSIVNCDVVAEQFVEQLCHFELDNLKLNPHVLDFFERLDLSQVKIILVSDTYYPQSAFEAFLEHLGIKEYFSVLYLSGERGVNKASGKMFKMILQAEKISAKHLIHIGDNVNSDCYQPQKLCINHVRYLPQMHDEVCSTIVEQQQALYDFGKYVLGPVIIDFCFWLQKHDPINPIFLARDGYMLAKVYQCLFPENDSDYLYFNRVMANQLDFNELNDAVITYLRQSHKADGLFALVKAFGLYQTDFQGELEKFCMKYGCHSGDLIDHALNKQLLSEPILVSSFKQSMQVRQKNTLGYLTSKINNKTINLIDVGWRGSVFKSASRHFSQLGDCYLMCAVVSLDDFVKGYVSTEDKDHLNLNTLSEYRDLIEWCLSENIGATQYIDDNLSVVRNHELSNSKQKNTVQKGILDSVFIQKRSQSLSVVHYLTSYLTDIPPAFFQAMCQVDTEIGIDGQSNVSFRDLLKSSKQEEVSVVNKPLEKQALVSIFLDFVAQLKNKPQLVVYGAGTGADFLLPHIEDEVDWIVDVNAALHGKKINSIEVKALDSLSHVKGCVVVTVIGRRKQISPLLEALPCEVLFLEDYLGY